MFKVDYHVHTAFSCDSEVPMEEMIKTGINKGLTEISLRKTCLHGTEKICVNLVEIVTNFRIFTENVDRIFKNLREIY